MEIPGRLTNQARLEAEVAELYVEHAARLNRYAVSPVRSDDLANDAVQETFLRYFAERSYGRKIEYRRAWLYQVLRHYLFDRLASLSAASEVGDEHLSGLTDPASGPQDLILHSEMADRIAASLSARKRECLGLRAEGFSYVEIAEVMGLKTGTVGVLLARAREKIRSAADEACAGESAVARAVRYLLSSFAAS